MPTDTILVDDEPLARRTLRMLIEAAPDFRVVAECGDGEEAARDIEARRPGLVFLDVQMPGLDGFGVIARVGAGRMPPVVFVTAHDEYAVRAFEVQALDYLLKPFDDTRFARCLERAREEIARNDAGALERRLASLLEERASGGNRPLRRIALRTGTRITFVDIADVDRFAAEDYYVRVHVGKDSYLWRMSMAALEQRLDPELFLRIHRSSIVNLARLKELHPGAKGDWLVVRHDGTRLADARNRHARIRELLSAGS